MARIPRILVVYAYHRYPMRRTTWDHLYCFDRSRQCETVYVNLRYRKLTRRLLEAKWDLVLFDTTFCGQRWSRPQFEIMVQKAAPLASLDTVKAIMPQDEMLNTDLLSDMVKRLGIDHVLTCASESEWEKIYGDLGPSVTFTRVLTGYLADNTLARIEDITRRTPKDVDVGYRASGPFWCGDQCNTKVVIGELFQEQAPGFGLSTDIDVGQTSEATRLLGDDWYEFLARCRYTIGVEGGASVLDIDGTVKQATDDYLKANPSASYREVREQCFADRDGELQLIALSPRHLEACATRTCQALIEGEFNGVLEPETHYIPIKPDFSNLDEVMQRMADAKETEAMVERAYQDVVASGQYSYESLVEQVLDTCLGADRAKGERDGSGFSLSRMLDRATWLKVWFVDTFFTPKH